MKRDLFGEVKADITLEMCITFLSAIGRASTQWRYKFNSQTTRPYLPLQLNIWIKVCY